MDLHHQMLVPCSETEKTGDSHRYYCLKKIREAIVTNTILPIRFPQGIDTMTIPCGKSIRQ
ncbi:MAG: hypothetical protein LBD21_08555, partial [Tannerellaceae bacterium]|nr:hypothetical protein [Tannerellaceae bacterium]